MVDSGLWVPIEGADPGLALRGEQDGGSGWGMRCGLSRRGWGGARDGLVLELCGLRDERRFDFTI